MNTDFKTLSTQRSALSLWLFLLLAPCSLLVAQQPTNVQKGGAAGVNNITADLNIGTGRTLTFASGSTATFSGTMGGTPTGGTLNLSNLTLTLPAATIGLFQPIDAALTALAAGSDYVQFTGPATSIKVFTLPDASSTLLYSGGALGTPSSGTLTNATGLPVSTGISGLGTGVATALAVNTGSAGAVVLFDGALGTPSSGTLTNATGLPVSTGISGLGTGVATALAATANATGGVVTVDGTATLTNKTLTSPVISNATASMLAYFNSSKVPSSVTLSGLTLTTGTLSVDQATTSAAGKVELATDAEALAGTDTARVAPVSSAEKRALLGDLTRQVKDALYSDGATSNRRVEWTPGTAGAIAALPISIPFEFDVPTSNPALNAEIFASNPAGYAGSSFNNSLYIRLRSADGGLYVLQTGATAASDYRQYWWANFRSTYSGQRIRGAVVFSSADSTTAPTIYVNGSDVTSNFSLTSAGTVPNWMPTTLDTTKFLSGYAWPAGRFIPHGPILGALTAAEVLEWTQTGRLPSWCEVGTGSAVNRISNVSRNSNFSAGATDFAPISVGSVAVVSEALECTAAQANNLFRLTSGFTGTNNFVPGRKYRVRYTVTANTGSLHSLRIGDQTPPTASSSGTGTFEQDIPYAAATTNYIQFIVVSNGAVVTFDDITVIDLGPIFKPVIQPIAVLADVGGNKIAGVLTSGVTPITEKRDWVIQDSTATNGNEQILGASVFFDYTKHVLDDWCMNTTGTPTVTAGSASAGTEYKASGALSATRNMITLVTRVTGTNNMWVGSNDTSTIYHTIRGHIVD